MIKNSKVYDFLKYTTQLLLPALAALYAALSAVWGWGYTDEVVGTISAAVTFLSAVLGISSATYHSKASEAPAAPTYDWVK